MSGANPPVGAIVNSDLSSPVGKKILADILRQLWERSGGPSDSVSDIDQEVNAQDSRKLVELRQLTRKVHAQALEIEQLRSELSYFKKLIQPKVEEFNCMAPQLKKIDSRLKHLELS